MIDPMKDFLGYNLKRASAVAMADLSSALAPTGLSPTVAGVLAMIDANPDTPQSRIGQALGIQRANIAPMIARLEKEALVERTQQQGRAIGLRCSPRGAKLAQQVLNIMKDHEARLFGKIANDQQEEFLQALQPILKREAP